MTRHTHKRTIHAPHRHRTRHASPLLSLNNRVYKKRVQKALAKFYGANVQLRDSTRRDKKFMIQNPANGAWVHFGQKGYSDWHMHRDPERRRRFRDRNASWASFPKYTPAHLAYYVLW